MWVFLYTLLSLAIIAVVISVISWIIYVPQVTKVFSRRPFFVPASHDARTDAEQCEFQTSDGFTLRGSLIRTASADRKGTIVYCHELNGNRWCVVPYLDCLLGEGYDVFTFDYRNHGESETDSGYRPLCWLTKHDMTDTQAAIDYLDSRSDICIRRLGMLGVSKGGTAALAAAVSDPRVHAVVADSAFPTLAMQQYYIRRFMPIYIRSHQILGMIPDICLISFCEWARYLVGVRENCRIMNIDRMVKKLRQPVFMIHGAKDCYIPVQVVQTLRGRLSGRSKLWVVPEASHTGAVAAANGEYRRRVARFFQTRLRAARQGV